MAKTATMTLRLDPTVKKECEELFGQFGITLSEAITIFLNKSIMERGLPFDVTLKKQPQTFDSGDITALESAFMQGYTPTEEEFTHLMDARFARMKAGQYIKHDILEA